MSVRIDRIQPGEYSVWCALWRDYLAFYETERPEALYRQNFAQLLGGQGPMFGFVARDATGAVIGLTHYFLHGTGWSFGETCYLQDLFVPVSHRGQGIARALIEAVASDARSRGCERLYWLTHTDNAPARQLYDQVASFEGFVCYERGLISVANDRTDT